MNSSLSEFARAPKSVARWLTGLAATICSAAPLWADAPALTTPPEGQTKCAGATATFTVVATGTAPLSYQWYFNEITAVTGATADTLSLPNVQVGQAGNYTVVVTNLEGAVTSVVAVLVVNANPTVTVNSETICAGGTATLTATTSAASPTYSWSPGGATTASIQVSPTSTTVYSVTVTDGTTTCSASGSGTVTVNPLPTVTVNSTTICVGDSATLTATTSASSPSYLWSPGGATTASITVSPAVSTIYSVTVTDGDTTCSSSGSGTVTVRQPDIFSSATPVTLNDNSSGSPYPANINVTGLTATVCKVTVTLANLNHAYPDDIDLLLVGPHGEAVLLMSDVGGSLSLSGVNLTFDDAAASSLADAGPIVSGTFKPTNIGAKTDGLNDVFPAPAPQVRYTTNLSSFNGQNPNGTWSLYVVDDEAIDAGSISGGWSLAITTLTPFADLAVSQTATPNPVGIGSNLTFAVTVNNLGPATANAVTLTDTLPAGSTFVSASGGCVPSGGSVTCTLGDLGPGASALVNITVTIPAAGTADHTASATTTTLEFVTANNTSTASASVLQPPVITVNPVGQTVCADHAAGLAVTAIGEPPLSYQWYQDGTLLSGATAATLTIPSAQAANAGAYVVVVANVVGAVSSSPVALTVNPLPAVTVASIAICAGSTGILAVTTSAANPSYLWSPGGEITPTISVSPAATAVYSVLVTDGVTGCTNSASATVTVNPLTVASAIQSFTNVCPGTAITFNTVASGTPPFTYVWRKNGTAIDGATTDTFTLPSVVLADAGTYTVEVTGGCRSVTNSGTLGVVAPPTIATQPANQATPMGNGAAFSVTANGVAPITYQWQLNGAAIVDATNSSVTVSNVTLAQSGSAYRVIASNCGGSVTSSVATLTVTPINGFSFDFDTPLQFTNAPYYLNFNNWINSSFVTPLVPFESPLGGTGPYPGSGALDLSPNNGSDNTSTLIVGNYDFSLQGKTLYAVTMFKNKSPVNNNRSTQIGFITATNIGLNDTSPQAFMSLILQSTAQPASTYEFRQQRRLTTGSLTESTLTPTTTLVVSNWYRIVAKFSNNKAGGSAGYTIEGTLQDMGPLGTTPGAVLLTFNNPTNFVNADMVNAKNVFLAMRGLENTGVDFRDNTYVYTTNGNIFFVQQPQNQTVAQGRRVIFKAMVDGEGPYSYQWFRNGNPIPGARSWNYILPPALTTDNGAQFTVQVTGPANTITSDPATLTVTSETLSVVSAGSVDGTTVGVLFSQPVQPAGAENPANYTIDGVNPVQARVYRTSLGPLGPEGIYVILTPASVLTGPYTVAVQNVLDRSGGALGAANTVNGRVEGLIGFDVGQPQIGPPGQNHSFGPGQFIVTGGGADIFNLADQFRYLYTMKTGDFDMIFRVPYMDAVRGPSKAAFEVRPQLETFGPQIMAAVNPVSYGRNFAEGTIRQTFNVATTSWGNNTTVQYPNAWLRLRRVGNTFLRYTSTNGTTWNSDGQTAPSPAFPATVFFGLAVCSVANNIEESAQFESFGTFGGYSGATIAITAQPTNATAAAGSGVSINNLAATVTGGGVPANELAFSWQRSDGAGGFTNMPNASAASLNVGTVYFSDNGAQFRCVLKAAGAADVTSAVVTLTVTDAAVPTVSSVNPNVLPSYPVSELVITFNELVAAASALDVANYAVTNTAGVRLTVLSASFLNGDPRTVALKVDGALGLGTASVGISGVRDLNNNAVATTVRTFRSFPASTAPVVAEVYQDIGNAPELVNLTGNALFTAGTPTFIVYSNLFGFNVSLAGVQDNYGVKVYSYFVPPTNGNYKFWIRSDDGFQFYMNTNGTSPAGKVLIAENAGANANYTVGSTPANSVTNITLVANTPYYIEALMKEGTGGDGFSVMWTDPTVNAAPAATVFIPPSALAYPTSVGLSTPVITELFTGYTAALTGNGNLPTLTSATNFPNSSYIENTVNFKYIAGTPDGIAYQKYFATQPALGNTRFDNYLGRMSSYFVAPSNGLYRFYMRSDDAAQLYMNTNTANSTDPAGKRLLGRLDVFTSAFTLVAQNVALTSGQRYYIETLWREGGGGDGVAVAVRSQGDGLVPSVGPPADSIPASMLEYPMVLRRSGAVDMMAVAPLNPTVVDGRGITLSAAGVIGAPPYGFFWLKNGVRVLENSITNVIPVLTMADNGAVYTLVVTNSFSRVERSAVMTVLPDNTAPTIVRCSGWRYGDGFTILFSEPMDAASATYLANYQLSGGLRLLGGTIDATRTMVSFRTTPQAAGTTYNVTLNNVRDGSSSANAIAANTVTSFSTWTVGGAGFLVEMFTNIPNSTIADLVGQAKFIGNMPDVVYYTNIFGVGAFGANSGQENYGARITGYFVPTTTGYYRFYLRSDDASQLWMNINSSNSEDPAGRTMLLHMPNANVNIQNMNAVSPPVSLNQGQRYYIEGLLKEGTGGDYLQVTFRNTDAAGNVIGALPVDNTANENSTSASFGGAGAPGNPDAIAITQVPPSELFVTESDQVNLVLGVNIPLSIIRAASFQWQRSNGAGGFTNIPGATASSYSFFATLGDNNARYKLTFSAPGRDATYETLMHVAPDTHAPVVSSVGSLDGRRIGIRFNERILPDNAIDVFNYTVNDGGPIVTAAVLRPDGTSVELTIEPPITGHFTVSVINMEDLSAAHNSGDSQGAGDVQGFIVTDVGAPAAAGSSFSTQPGEVDVLAGGADIWGTADQGHVTLAPRSGNFDISVQVPLLQRNGTTDTISKAGLMVRENLNADSRSMYWNVNPPASIGGRDIYEAGQRPVVAGATAAFLDGGAANTLGGIPNAWLRLQRIGNTFIAYRSTNGVDWIAATTNVVVYPDRVYIGLGTTAHNNTTPPILAQYRNFYFPPVPIILTQPAPAVQSVALGSSVSYTVVASNPPNSGPLVYQWKKNGNPLPGKTSATLTIPSAASADSGAYVVDVGNDGGTATSIVLGLRVLNQPPVVVGESLSVTGNTAVTISGPGLLTNDSDPEGRPIGLFAISGRAPGFYATGFDNGVAPETPIFGNALVADDGTGTNNVLHLTDVVGNAFGVYYVPSPVGDGVANQALIRWRSRVGGGTNGGIQFNRPGADGYSLTWGNDLPAAPAYGVPGEDGVGTNLVVAFDTWDSGGGEAPSIEMRWRGNRVAFDAIDANQGYAKDFLIKDRFVDVSLTVDDSGAAVLTYDGRTISAQLAGWTGIAGGGFMFGARTGGAQENHWIDDLSIAVATSDTSRGGTVSINHNTGAITYTPPAGACGPDALFYVVSDGQIDGLSAGRVSLQLYQGDPVPPLITTCAPNISVGIGAGCLASIPDLTTNVVATDCAPFVLTQSPAPGALRGPGAHIVTLTASNTFGLSSSCTATVTVTAATLVINTQPSDVTTPAGATVSFTVAATGNPPLTYQWFRESTAVAGATAATLSFPNVQLISAGNYHVVVNDACGASVTSVTVALSVKVPPVALDDKVKTAKNQALAIPTSTLLANDSDPDGGTVTVTSVSAASRGGGTVVLAGSTVTYTPAAGFAATDTFTYTITDDEGATATATVCVVVSGANLAYNQPAGGWTYVYDGSSATAGADNSGFTSLDGTWNHDNGSDTWARDLLGGVLAPTSNPPGGATTLNGFLRLQDPGDPRAAGFTETSAGGNAGSVGSNRKLYFGHNITADGASASVINSGVTLSFRARVPTNGLDDNYLSATPTPYPAAGDGYLVHDGGKGNIGIHQASGGTISFSLAVATDTGGSSGLLMNNLNGTTITGVVDSGESGTANLLALDPTDWHEFWVTLRADNAGGGTHRVEIYRDGSTTPSVFNVTAGDGAEGQFGTISYMAMGVGSTAQSGALDVDFYGFKAGVLVPIPLDGPDAPPQLKITRDGTDVVISWPQTCGTFQLQSTVSLLPVNWAAVAQPVTVNGSNFQVLVPITGNLFFRLIH
jgi:uncharacterized repeat protein (TIGR01451 family)